MITSQQIVEENFKGLDELIEDKDLLYFYKSLIATCLDGFGESIIEELVGQSQEMLYEVNKDERGEGLVKRIFQHTYAIPKQTILELKEKLK